KPTDRLKRYSSRKGRPSGPPFLFAGGKSAPAANHGKVPKVRHGESASMAEAADELSAPLGRDIARGRRRFRLPFTKMQVLATALGLFLLTFAGYALFNDDPFGGEPLVRIA